MTTRVRKLAQKRNLIGPNKQTTWADAWEQASDEVHDQVTAEALKRKGS
jgi:hypothetical protein